MTAVNSRVVPVVIVMSVLLLLPRFAAAHCDTMDGPVVKAAKLALKAGDVTPVLRWVPLDAEGQIRAAFEQTLKVRMLSPEAREFADNYFFETLVRVHRASEGEAYTGLKPGGIEIEPGIALADNSLDTGSVDALIGQVKSDAAQGIRQRFTRAQETSKHTNDSVEAGRQFVAAYVEFIHYVENIHQALSDPASHPPQEAQVTKAVQH
jgi:hypothetical protein